MFEFLASMVSLPNIHPVVVHFPVALAFTALAVEAGSLIMRRQTWLERAAALLYGLAAAGAGVAYLAGRQAADTVGVISARAEVIMADHADLALWTLVVLGIGAVVRVAASLMDRQRAVSRFSALRAAGVLLLVVAVGLIARTADLGGSLVYRFGIAVNTAEPESVSSRAPQPAVEEAAVDAGSRLARSENGGLEWRPLATDAAALGEVISPAPGSDPSAVSAVAGTGEGTGLELAVDGASLLVLPGTFNDVVIEAEVDLTGFEGTVGIAHHAAAADIAVLFTVSTGGEASLLRRKGGQVEVFGTEAVAAPSGVLALQSSAAGHHFKGFIDGRMVVHGHGDPGDPGRVGLFVDGRGVIRVLRVTVAPAGDN